MVAYGSGINRKEIKDLLMIISSDPDKLTFFNVEYGSQNVEMAIRKASKILYPEGRIDENLSEFLWNKRELIFTSNISDFTKKSCDADWRAIKRCL